MGLIRQTLSIQKVFGWEVVAEAVLPRVCQLAHTSKWRTRLSLVQHLPQLAKTIGEDVYDRHLTITTLNWLADQVQAIREAAVVCLGRLTKIFGLAWAKARIFPALAELSRRNSYTYRLTSCMALTDIVPAVWELQQNDPKLATTSPTPETREQAMKADEDSSAATESRKADEEGNVEMSVSESSPRHPPQDGSVKQAKETEESQQCLLELEILPGLLALAQDRVPNVRLSAARGLGRLSSFLQPGPIQGIILPALQDLILRDCDPDVQFFSRRAVSVLLKDCAFVPPSPSPEGYCLGLDPEGYARVYGADGKIAPIDELGGKVLLWTVHSLEASQDSDSEEEKLELWEAEDGSWIERIANPSSRNAAYIHHKQKEEEIERIAAQKPSQQQQ